ncbi:MAG: phenylacetate--CoA ligase family protein [Anaerolineales bacterium]|nr:phenylacetate--CoA ligase family protein [Anaerolineales bacterium]
MRSDLEAYQLEQLRQTIQFARQKSRFYSEHLANAPQDISRLDDLNLFPFTTPDNIRNEGQQLICVSQSDIHRVVTLDTSGTTGKPKRIYFTRADQELTIDFFHHGMSTFTKPGDRVMILLPCERPGSVGDLLAIGLTRLGAIPVRHGPPIDPSEALSVMETQHIDGMVGVPAHILTMARLWNTEHKAGRHTPQQVLLSTDHLPRAIKSALVSIWECTVYDHYGMTEMGLGGGVECQAHRGYHLREADMFFEIIHPDTGEAVAEGAEGEVVFTTLTRSGMPLIRYRTGDISRFIPGQCPCGTSLRALERISRRLNGQIYLAENSGVSYPIGQPALCMADLDEAIFPIPQVLTFSANIIKQENDTYTSKDQLNISLVVVPDVTMDEKENIANRAQKALNAVSAIQIASQSGMMDICIHIQELEANNAGSMAKRVIVDRR